MRTSIRILGANGPKYSDDLLSEFIAICNMKQEQPNGGARAVRGKSACEFL